MVRTVGFKNTDKEQFLYRKDTFCQGIVENG